MGHGILLNKLNLQVQNKRKIKRNENKKNEENQDIKKRIFENLAVVTEKTLLPR